MWRLGGPKVNSPAPFAAGERAAKAARRAKARATLAVDLSAIKIEKGVVYQPPASRASQWNALFEQMEDIEDSFAISLQAKHALAHAAAQYRKKFAGHFRFSIRNVSETHCRIWRKA